MQSGSASASVAGVGDQRLRSRRYSSESNIQTASQESKEAGTTGASVVSVEVRASRRRSLSRQREAQYCTGKEQFLSLASLKSVAGCF